MPREIDVVHTNRIYSVWVVNVCMSEAEFLNLSTLSKIGHIIQLSSAQLPFFTNHEQDPRTSTDCKNRSQKAEKFGPMKMMTGNNANPNFPLSNRT